MYGTAMAVSAIGMGLFVLSLGVIIGLNLMRGNQ